MGGAHLSATEKDALDFWYICNASLSLDLRILGMTLISLLRGDRRSEQALARANSFLAQHVHGQAFDPPGGGLNAKLGAAAVTHPLREHPREALVGQSR